MLPFFPMPHTAARAGESACAAALPLRALPRTRTRVTRTTAAAARRAAYDTAGAARERRLPRYVHLLPALLPATTDPTVYRYAIHRVLHLLLVRCQMGWMELPCELPMPVDAYGLVVPSCGLTGDCGFVPDGRSVCSGCRIASSAAFCTGRIALPFPVRVSTRCYCCRFTCLVMPATIALPCNNIFAARRGILPWLVAERFLTLGYHLHPSCHRPTALSIRYRREI